MRSGELYPGDRLQHADGMVVTLARRKRPSDGCSAIPFHPGWWLTDGGGLADFVIDDPESPWRQYEESSGRSASE